MITLELMERLFPTSGLNPRKYNLVRQRQELVDALNKFLPKYEINTYRRVCAFLACCGIETDYFRTSSEYASGADYEGRKNLGNTQPGDGRKFKGRGLIQTTGRWNYSVLNRTIGKVIGIDFIAHPEKLNEIAIAVESACVFWQTHNLNRYADAKQIKALNGVVNRGSADKMPLHWSKRNELYPKCIRKIPQTFTFESNAVAIEPAAPVEAPTAEPSNVQPLDTAKIQSQYETIAPTLQHPTVKQVAAKASWRVGTAIAGIWSTTAGKIALMLTAFALIGGIGYAIYLYRKPIQIGYEIAKATVKKFFGFGGSA